MRCLESGRFRPIKMPGIAMGTKRTVTFGRKSVRVTVITVQGSGTPKCTTISDLWEAGRISRQADFQIHDSVRFFQFRVSQRFLGRVLHWC